MADSAQASARALAADMVDPTAEADMAPALAEARAARMAEVAMERASAADRASVAAPAMAAMGREAAADLDKASARDMAEDGVADDLLAARRQMLLPCPSDWQLLISRHHFPMH